MDGSHATGLQRSLTASRNPAGFRSGYAPRHLELLLEPQGAKSGLAGHDDIARRSLLSAELKLTNDVDANGRAVRGGRARVAGDRSIVVFVAVVVVAKLLFEIIVFFSRT